ncbi:uncharacterized protein LOC132748497 [Ruditapes philippinarum]|uniref:uncharacterized protein LOC132748497 n=1 Tax=Ruditapes philippinarum TaxID=129788 RepID=UPI00295AEBDC|nr:uncharacterized protein LOC132748497 [Ruditapes philippinarum]
MEISKAYVFLFTITFVLIFITYLVTKLGVRHETFLNYNSKMKNESVEILEIKKGAKTGNTTEEEKNGTCEFCFKRVPNLIVQFGKPRTATTLQFYLLCLMMAFLHEDEKNSVGCYYNRFETNNKYRVIKVHSIPDKGLSFIPTGSWIFMTSKGPLTKPEQDQARKLKQRRIAIPYIADVNLVSKRGHFIAYEYQKFFGLSNENMTHVVEYLRYWDILRVCCGTQMSSDWRNHLAPEKNYRNHHDPHSLLYPACEMYNISNVETLLLKSHAYKTFSSHSSLKNILGKPSLIDGNLDGSYCKRCNANISKNKLHMNKRCT